MAFSAPVENLVLLPTDPVANKPQENDAKNARSQIGEGKRSRRNEGL